MAFIYRFPLKFCLGKFLVETLLAYFFISSFSSTICHVAKADSVTPSGILKFHAPASRSDTSALFKATKICGQGSYFIFVMPAKCYNWRKYFLGNIRVRQ